MSLVSKGKSSINMRIRDLENVLRHRRIPYPKRSVEFIALIAISCTLFLFLHTKNLNSRLKEMEVKLQPSEFSALGLTGDNHIDESKHHHDRNTLHGTYQYLKSTGQLFKLNPSDLNNTKNSEVDILLFNRVPKVGSVQMISLLKTLGKTHNFEVFSDGNLNGGILRNMPSERQQQEVEKVLNRDDPGVFVSHMNWINFTEYGQPKPIYINMVRDPVERVISWFYYVRSPWIFIPQRRQRKQRMPNAKWMNTEFDECVEQNMSFCQYKQGAGFEQNDTDHRRQTLFFCGNDKERCEAFNSRGPLQMAKMHVEKEYAVVGLWEDTNITLTVLEHYIPKYFKGATHLYYLNLENDHQNANPMKPHIKEEVKEMVRKNFTREIEFYQFCKQRLYKQYLAIKLNEIRSLK